MAKETPDVEIIQGAEYARSTETVINEKGTTLSEYKTNSTGANDQESPSEVDAHSGGRDRDRMEQTSQAFYSSDKRAATSPGVALSESHEDTMKEAKEVEEELGWCCCRVAHDDIAYFKKRIEKGEVEVTNDPSLRKAVMGFSPGDTLVHGETLECLLSEEARLKGLLPHEEQRPLRDFELYGYEGAISALRWLQGHHDQDLVAYLVTVSDRFELVMETPEISATLEGGVQKSEEIISNNSRHPQGAASSAISQSRNEIEQELGRLLILHELQHYEVLKAKLEEGVAVISTDPNLKEDRPYESEDTTMVHADYREVLESFAKHAKRDLPKKLRDELPLNMLQEGRVHGAICALHWFLGGENTKLASSLNFAVEDKASRSS
jgi:hypothetical protein